MAWRRRHGRGWHRARVGWSRPCRHCHKMDWCWGKRQSSCRWDRRLRDEIVDDTMEKHAVVQPRFYVCDHVVRGDGRPLLKQFDDDGALFSGRCPSGLVGDVHRDDGVAGVGRHHLRTGFVDRWSVGPFGRVKTDASPRRFVCLHANGGGAHDGRQEEHHEEYPKAALVHDRGWSTPP